VHIGHPLFQLPLDPDKTVSKLPARAGSFHPWERALAGDLRLTVPTPRYSHNKPLQSSTAVHAVPHFLHSLANKLASRRRIHRNATPLGPLKGVWRGASVGGRSSSMQGVRSQCIKHHRWQLEFIDSARHGPRIISARLPVPETTCQTLYDNHRLPRAQGARPNGLGSPSRSRPSTTRPPRSPAASRGGSSSGTPPITSTSLGYHLPSSVDYSGSEGNADGGHLHRRFRDEQAVHKGMSWWLTDLPLAFYHHDAYQYCISFHSHQRRRKQFVDECQNDNP